MTHVEPTIRLGSAVPEDVLILCTRLRRAGHGAWAVGGCVRDTLLQRPVSDWDLATSATPQEVMGIFNRTIPTGVQHGTVTVVLRNSSFEVTTLRGDGEYLDGRRPQSVHFVRDIVSDLERRDFTINAMAYDPLTHDLVDPFHGQRDLRKGWVRAVGDHTKRFEEDGLRIMRAARFCASLGFALNDDTRAGMAASAMRLDLISKERIRDELLKICGAPKPSIGLDILMGVGGFAVVCPPLQEQVNLQQNKYHAHTLWQHTLHCVDDIRRDPILRVAALLHDLGKPQSRAWSDKHQDYTFFQHEMIGADLADGWLRQHRFSNHDCDLVVSLVRHHLVAYERGWSDAAVRRFVRRVGPDRVDALLELARADVQAKGKHTQTGMADLEHLRARIERVKNDNAPLTVSGLHVSGKDIIEDLSVPPGPRVGEVLRHLLEQVLDDPQRNKRETLINLARQYFETRMR